MSREISEKAMEARLRRANAEVVAEASAKAGVAGFTKEQLQRQGELRLGLLLADSRRIRRIKLKAGANHGQGK